MVVVAMAFHPAEAGCHFSARVAVAIMSWPGRAAFFFGIETLRIGIFQLKKHGEKTCEKRFAKNPPVSPSSHDFTCENI